MARQLEDIIADKFSDMTHEQKLDFIKGVRKSRRTLKATSRVVKQVKRTAKKRVEKTMGLFDNLTAEERAVLIEELTNGKG
jgi:acyl-coenzyme A thioesterase PaaI-like protein